MNHLQVVFINFAFSVIRSSKNLQIRLINTHVNLKKGPLEEFFLAHQIMIFDDFIYVR